HAGSGPAPGKFTGDAPVAELLKRYPDLCLIIAHMGMPEWEPFIDLAIAYRNVYLDTTMCFVDFWQGERERQLPTSLLPRLEALQQKILFGTDFPNIPYAYAHQVEALARLGLGDGWLRDVLWHNGIRLFPQRAGEPGRLS